VDMFLKNKIKFLDISRILLNLSIESPIPPWIDSEPPLKPVLAPIGVTGIIFLKASFIILETCSTLAGFTKTSGGKIKFSVSSCP
jgi:hypothetical protein